MPEPQNRPTLLAYDPRAQVLLFLAACGGKITVPRDIIEGFDFARHRVVMESDFDTDAITFALKKEKASA